MLATRLRTTRFGEVALPAARTTKLTALWARAAIRRGGVVLMYHQVTDTDVSIWDTAVSVGRFRAHMEALLATRRPVLPFGAFAAAVRSGTLPRRAVCITFDDGYADNALLALPILEELGLPATFFVAGCAIDSPTEMWWDELERVLLTTPELPDQLEVTIGDEQLRFTIDGAAADSNGWHASLDDPRCGRQAALHAIWSALMPRSLEEKQAICAQLVAWAGIDPAPRASHRMLTSEELARMAASPLVEIGSHTMTHASLPSADDLAWELIRSREELAKHVDAPVDTIAYPSGHHDQRVRDATVAAGYAAAASCDVGPVLPGADPYAIPRIMVKDWSGRELAQRLRAVG